MGAVLRCRYPQAVAMRFGPVTRAHFVVALLASALVALLVLALVAWMTSGAWSPARVDPVQLALVFSMVAVVELGFGRASGLLVCLAIYWSIAFAVLAWCITRAGLKLRPKRNERSEV